MDGALTCMDTSTNSRRRCVEVALFKLKIITTGIGQSRRFLGNSRQDLTAAHVTSGGVLGVETLLVRNEMYKKYVEFNKRVHSTLRNNRICNFVRLCLGLTEIGHLQPPNSIGCKRTFCVLRD